MGFRNPITTAIDPTARQAAANAQATADSKAHIFLPSSLPPTAPAGGFVTGDQWPQILKTGGIQLNLWDGSAKQWKAQQFGAGTLVAGAVVAGTLAADAIDGMTITGVTVRTGASGTARAVIYEGTDGKGNPMGVIQLEDGISGDTPVQIYAGAFSGGGGGVTISGGAYTGAASKAAAKLVLQTDQANLSTAQLTAPDGLWLNGQLVAWQGSASCFHGTVPTGGAPQIVQAGSAVVTPNASGIATLSFPAMPNAIVSATVTPGDNTANIREAIILTAGNTLGSFQVLVRNTSGGLVTSTVRLNFTVIGC